MTDTGMADNGVIDGDIMNMDWITEYENEERYYTMFYPEPTKSIKVNLFYVNKKNEVEKIRERLLNLETENKITKEELLHLVKENQTFDKIKYKLVSILIYNITLKHDELRNFLRGTDKYEFMASLKTVDDYELQSTINCLQSVNNIYIICKEEETNEASTKMANTKRVRFNIAQKKTKRRHH